MIISVFIFGVFVGFILFRFSVNLSIKNHNKKIKSDCDKKFRKVLKSLETSEFKTKINNLVYININIDDENFDIIYSIDRNDISLWKGDSIDSVTTTCDRKIIDEIIDTINKKYSNDINNTINILGTNIYKIDFDNFINSLSNKISLISDEMIIPDKNVVNRLNIDDILDKISKYGIETLSKDEKDFLNKFSNNGK